MPLDQKGYTSISTKILVRLPLTHSSTIRGKSSYLGGSTKSSLSLAIPNSALRSENGWISSCSRLFPGLQTVGGIASTACLVRLRRSRRLARLEHYSNTLARRTVKQFDVHQLSCFSDGPRNLDVIRTWSRITRRVVMDDDDCRGITLYRRT